MNDKDTIYRQDAVDILCAKCFVNTPATCSTIQHGDRWCYEVYELLHMPSAQRTGEWIPIIEGNEFGEAYQAGICCSECGETFGCEANFCPNCGADMRGNNNETD